jgi:hypothetical protein
MVKLMSELVTVHYYPMLVASRLQASDRRVFSKGIAV